MQLRELEYLLKIVECGSVTKAAEQLFISQPTLTKNIQNLESEYGIKLFHRIASGMELTEEGQNFVYYAREVIAATEALNSNFSGGKLTAQPRLYVATQRFDFTHDIFLKTYLQNSSRNMHGGLIETDRDNVIVMVLQRAADIGIFIRTNSDGKTFLWKTQADQIDIHHIAQERIFVCVGPNSPLYDRTELSLAEAQKHPSFALDMKSPSQQNTYIDNRLSHLQRRKVFFFNSIGACSHFLLHTDMILYINKWTSGCFTDPRIHIIPIVDNDSKPYYNELVWCKRIGEPLSLEDKQFLHHLYHHFGLPPENFSAP